MALSEPARIKAVVFDIDGTLLDSVDSHAKAWVEAFAHFGVTVSEADALRQIGKGGDQLLRVFLDEDRVARDGEAIESYRSDLFKRAYLPTVRPFPGAKALCARVRNAGQRVVLASSGRAAEVDRYHEIIGITDLVDHVVSADDAERSKPYPDIFEAALKALGDLDASEAMAVGDTPYDAEAAAKVGLRTIGLLGGGFSESDLMRAGCVAVYPDAQALLDGYDTSPLAATAT